MLLISTVGASKRVSLTYVVYGWQAEVTVVAGNQGQ
jgi:hypothetical protein